MDENRQSEIFKVLSSDGVGIYQVQCSLLPGRVLVACTCKSGELGKLCKHQLYILNGDSRLIVDDGASDKLLRVKAWVQQSLLQGALEELASAEAGKTAAENRLKAAKDNLRKLIRH